MLRLILAVTVPLIAATAANAADPTFQTSAGAVRVETVARGLVYPWALAFLPDGRMLVTQKAGTMVILSADGKSVLAAVDGLPAVIVEGMGGLLDVVIDPEFARDPWVYWAYSEAGSGAEAGKAATSVARGRLAGSTLRDVSVLFRQGPKVGGASHFGARLAFRGDGTLFIALGDRKQLDPPGPTRGAESLFRQFAKTAKQALTFGVPMLSPQSLATDLGKVVRINRDGTMPVLLVAVHTRRPKQLAENLGALEMLPKLTPPVLRSIEATVAPWRRRERMREFLRATGLLGLSGRGAG